MNEKKQKVEKERRFKEYIEEIMEEIRWRSNGIEGVIIEEQEGGNEIRGEPKIDQMDREGYEKYKSWFNDKIRELESRKVGEIEKRAIALLVDLLRSKFSIVSNMYSENS